MLSFAWCCLASDSSSVALGSSGELGGFLNEFLSLKLSLLLLIVFTEVGPPIAFPTPSFGSQSMAVKLLFRSAMTAEYGVLANHAAGGPGTPHTRNFARDDDNVTSMGQNQTHLFLLTTN